MRDLSLFILDIAQNSVAAGARLIRLELAETGNALVFTIRDDGCGMDAALLAKVTDPFATTRDTRPVGLGLPFLRMAAEQTGGGISIESAPGAGTTVTARFDAGHIDMPPQGNLAETVAALIQGAPDLDCVWTHRRGERSYTLDTRELRPVLDGVSLGEPEVARWILEYISEREASLAAPEGEEQP